MSISDGDGGAAPQVYPLPDRPGWRPLCFAWHRGYAYNVKIGDPALVGPGIILSQGIHAVLDKRTDPKNQAYNVLSCIGNTAVVVSGDAKGAKGYVTGIHGD